MAAFSYEYVRDLDPAHGWFDIGYNDPEAGRVEPPLSGEINTAISKIPLVRCSANTCQLIFDQELTPEEKTAVDQVVADHKAAAYPV